MTGEHLRIAFNIHQKRQLVPFAVKQDCDDFVAWSGQHDGCLARFDGAAMGFGPDHVYTDLWQWFQQAVNDFAEFHSGVRG